MGGCEDRPGASYVWLWWWFVGEQGLQRERIGLRRIAWGSFLMSVLSTWVAWMHDWMD